MQVILDSSFARPGLAPIWVGKKGEFRDWTNGFTDKDSTKVHNKTLLLLSWESSTSTIHKSISELELNTSFNLILLTKLKLVQQFRIFYQPVMTTVYHQSKKHQLIKINR